MTMNGSALLKSGQNCLVQFSREEAAARSTTTMRFEKVDKGGVEVNVLKVEGIPVFRSGTFRDSTGWQSTWDSLHMNAMVMHHNHLKETGIFADVPVRAGHPSFLGGNTTKELIGYVTALRTEKRESPVDGKEYDYLVADYDILDPEAQQKISSGLWRNRSAEVGTYVTNDEAEYAPTFMGVAYVDISAVEALNFSASSGVNYMMEETMPGLPQPTPPATENPAPPAPFAFSLSGGRSETDTAAVQSYISSLEAEHTAAAARVAELEAFAATTRDNERAAFVTALANENKIGAEQVDALTAFGKSLTEEQYAAWTASFAAAKPDPMFGKHGVDGAGQPAPEPVTAPAPGDVSKGILRRLHQSGTAVAKIKATAAYGKVVAAEPGFVLETFLNTK